MSHNDNSYDEAFERRSQTLEEATDYEVETDSGTIALLNKSEIDQQVSTAKKYPRSLKKFRDECLSMVTLSESIAKSCIYALPRGGKSIEGPTARFAEVVLSAWGNARAGARVVSTEEDFIRAMGTFYDLERNVAIQYEVGRRITDKKGDRYNDDMINVTGNAACSVALRNAILKGVPKAFWEDMYIAARKTSIGDIRTLVTKRANAIEDFGKMGVTPEMIFRSLSVNGIEDIGVEHLVTLHGTFTALKEGETTIEQAFDTAPVTRKADEKLSNGSRSRLDELKERHGVGKSQPSQSQAETAPATPGEAAQAPTASDSTSSSTLTPEQRRAAEEAQAKIDQRRQEEEAGGKVVEGLPGIFETPQPAIATAAKKSR
jgi:hypothetical protein